MNDTNNHSDERTQGTFYFNSVVYNNLDSVRIANAQSVLSNFVVLYRFLPFAAFEATLENWALKATLSYEANDPLEMTPGACSSDRKVLTQINSVELDPNPFICFSRVISSPAMWGHYADSGKGVCMVFLLPVGKEVSDKWKYNTRNDDLAHMLNQRETPSLQGFRLQHTPRNSKQEAHEAIVSSYLLPVRYTEDRVLSLTEFLANKQVNADAPYEQTLPFLQEWSRNLISTKAMSWQYEEELRLICEHSHACKIEGSKVLYEWPMAYLAGVVTGPRCTYSVKTVKRKIDLAYERVKNSQPNCFCPISKFLYGYNFVVSKATYHWKRFEIEAQPWSNHQEGWGVTFDLLLSALLLHVEPEVLGLSKEEINSWNDFQNKINENGFKRQLADDIQSRGSIQPVKIPSMTVISPQTPYTVGSDNLVDSGAISGFPDIQPLTETKSKSPSTVLYWGL